MDPPAPPFHNEVIIVLVFIYEVHSRITGLYNMEAWRRRLAASSASRRRELNN
jgi:hypothetical protein